MEKHPVALIPITTYDQAAVDAAVLQGVDLLGGIARFVQPEERVLLKPNLLSRALPQKAITTHPAVFSAVCRLLHESGYTHLSYGDSPGNPTTSPDKAAQASGVAEAAKRYGVEMADFFSGSVVPFPDGHTAKSFYLCKGVQDADAIWREEIAKAGLDKEISQYYAALTNMHSVGVMGDERTYDYAVALRAVTTTDFMTAESYNMPWDVLGTVTSRIVNEVKHVNRVFYDCTGKPPATIELE